MRRHASGEDLARLDEGDLGQAKAARVRAHLAGCTRCANLSAELSEVTAMLASAPAPAMPEHLASRITDTLAAEAAQRVALEPGTEPGRRDLPSRAGGSRSWPRPWRLRLSSPAALLRTLAAAGVIAVIAGGTYAIVGQYGPTGQGGGVASGRSAVRGAGSAARSDITAGPGVAVGPNSAVPAAGPELHYRGQGGPGSVVPVATGTNFGPAHLATQVDSALSQVRAGSLAGTPSAEPSRSAAGQPSDQLGHGQPGGARFGGLQARTLAACVGRFAAGGRVLLVDVARYLGERATIIVTSRPGGTTLRTWVVGPACSGSRGDVIAERTIPAG
jgi:hypothetical protein